MVKNFIETNLELQLCYNNVTVLLQNILILSLLIYFLLLVFDSNNYLKILIFFELLLLTITVIFLVSIQERVDHIALLFLVMVGGESGLALSVIFPFLIK